MLVLYYNDKTSRNFFLLLKLPRPDFGDSTHELKLLVFTNAISRLTSAIYLTAQKHSHSTNSIPEKKKKQQLPPKHSPLGEILNYSSKIGSTFPIPPREQLL